MSYLEPRYSQTINHYTSLEGVPTIVAHPAPRGPLPFAGGAPTRAPWTGTVSHFPNPQFSVPFVFNLHAIRASAHSNPRFHCNHFQGEQQKYRIAKQRSELRFPPCASYLSHSILINPYTFIAVRHKKNTLKLSFLVQRAPMGFFGVFSIKLM